MKGKVGELKGHLLTGISYMLPACIIGGIFFAFAIAFGGTAVEGQGMVITNQIWKDVQTIGNAGLSLMIVIMGGYTAYSIAGKPALAPAIIASYIANSEVGASGVKSGFLGAMLMGLLIGYVTKYLKKVKYPDIIKPLVPLFVIPLIDGILILLYIEILAAPIGAAMSYITGVMDGLSSASLVVVAIVIGCMITFDMGGPINKTCCIFLLVMTAAGDYRYLGMFGVAACVPPLGMGIATLLAKKKYTEEERAAGKTALFMGVCGISEGAIPFAASDPIRVIPAAMLGGSVGSVIAALGGSINYAPHGGLIVLAAVEGKLWYVLGVIVGTAVTALTVNLLKKNLPQEEA